MLLTVFSSAQAVPEAQSYFTPTPGADGRILYVVQEGDNCIIIELKTGVKVDQLRILNNLDDACSLFAGQQLLLGIFEPPTTTPGPTPTPGPIVLTPTPFKGNGRVCVYLYDDSNGNGVAEDGETPIKDGVVSLTDREGKISRDGRTSDIVTEDGPQYLCFEDIPEGGYNVSVAPPEGYNPTTTMNYPLKLMAGDQSILDFGAQLSSRGLPTPVAVDSGSSPLLAILGAVLVLAGIGLAVYLRLLKR